MAPKPAALYPALALLIYVARKSGSHDRRLAALTPIEFTDHSASDNAYCQARRSVIPSDGSPPMSGAANARDRHD